jgi:hypothetical protein
MVDITPRKRLVFDDDGGGGGGRIFSISETFRAKN